MPSAIPDAFVYDAIRTPRGRGKQNGALHEVKPVNLVVGLIDELRRRFPDLDPTAIDENRATWIDEWTELVIG